jgi:hypothetical protein
MNREGIRNSSKALSSSKLFWSGVPEGNEWMYSSRQFAMKCYFC